MGSSWILGTFDSGDKSALEPFCEYKGLKNTCLVLPIIEMVLVCTRLLQTDYCSLKACFVFSVAHYGRYGWR